MSKVRWHETKPLFYDIRKLSEQGMADRDHLQDELRKQVSGAHTLVGIDLAEADERIAAIVYSLRWQGANPKKVPFDEYVELVRSRKADRTKNENDAAKRINNRATAIRAYCIGCMCGDTVLVRNCTSLTCPLHPFRLGSDSFRGYEPPKPVIDVKLDDGFDDGVFEYGDD